MMMIAGDGVCETIHVPKEPQVTCLATSPRLLLMQPGILGLSTPSSHSTAGAVSSLATPLRLTRIRITLPSRVPVGRYSIGS